MDDNVRNRIFAAADELHEQNGRTKVPTVSEVRKQSKVDMNEACEGMREWRRSLGQRTALTVGVPLPTELRDLACSALASFWKEATDMASEALITAQATWEAEKRLSEELCQQMAADFDAQAVELSDAHQELTRLVALSHQHTEEVRTTTDQLAIASQERDIAQHGRSEALARLAELSKRVDDNERAIAHAREETNTARNQLASIRLEHSQNSERARAEFRREIDSERDRFERERQRYEQIANQATVEAASLRGQIQAAERISTRSHKTSSRRAKQVTKR